MLLLTSYFYTDGKKKRKEEARALKIYTHMYRRYVWKVKHFANY